MSTDKPAAPGKPKAKRKKKPASKPKAPGITGKPEGEGKQAWERGDAVKYLPSDPG